MTMLDYQADRIAALERVAATVPAVPQPPTWVERHQYHQRRTYRGVVPGVVYRECDCGAASFAMEAA